MYFESFVVHHVLKDFESSKLRRYIYEEISFFFSWLFFVGGQKLWDDSESEEFRKQSFGDGLLEVVSLKSSADVGLAAVGIKVLCV